MHASFEVERSVLTLPMAMRRLLALALPILVAQLASIGMMLVDTVVLGCTHNPWASAEIARRLPPETRLVDTGEAVARQLTRCLQAEHCAGGGHSRLLAGASVEPATLAEKIERLWGAPLPLIFWSPQALPEYSA